MTSSVYELTLHEKYYGNKSGLSHVRMFGSIAYVHILGNKQQNLDPKLEKCILVGYSLEKRGINASNPLLGRFV